MKWERSKYNHSQPSNISPRERLSTTKEDEPSTTSSNSSIPAANRTTPEPPTNLNLRRTANSPLNLRMKMTHRHHQKERTNFKRGRTSRDYYQKLLGEFFKLVLCRG